MSVTNRNWPPRCPKCESQLGLASSTSVDGHATLKGYRCTNCRADFTWRSLNEWRTQMNE